MASTVCSVTGAVAAGVLAQCVYNRALPFQFYSGRSASSVVVFPQLACSTSVSSLQEVLWFERALGWDGGPDSRR